MSDSQSSDKTTNTVIPTLDRLIRGYIGSLKFVFNLPSIGRLHIEGYYRSKDGKNADKLSTDGTGFQGFWKRITFPSKKLIVKQFILYYLERHIRNRLQEINSILKMESAASTGSKEKSDYAQEINAAIERVQKLQDSFRSNSWKIASLITKAPWISLLIAVGTIFYQADPSNDVNSFQSLYKLFFNSEFNHAIMLLLGTLVVLFIICSPIPVNLGFKIKKAILAGGSSIAYINEELTVVLWKDFPGCNVYELENVFFKETGIEKQKEVQVDLFIGVFPYILTIMSISLIVNFFSKPFDFGDGILALGFSLGAIRQFRTSYKIGRGRKEKDYA